jgi:hypothetical protein
LHRLGLHRRARDNERVMLRRFGILVVAAFSCVVGACNLYPPTVTGGTASTCTVTVSNASALRSAAGTTGSGDVCVAPGSYSVSSSIPIASGVRLHGTGATLTYSGPRSTLGLFNAMGTYNILVEGFTLDGSNQIATGFRSQSGAHQIEVRGLTIRNMGEGGVQFQQSDHVVATGNTISHAGYTIGWGSGIGLWWGGQGSTSTYDTAAGFHAVIANNEISDIVDGSIYDTDGNGIIVDGGGVLYPVLITGNVIHDVRGRGVSSTWNSGELWVVNNTVVRASNADSCSYASYSVQGFTGNVRWVNNISQPGCGPNYGQESASTGLWWTNDIDANSANANLTPSPGVSVANPMLGSDFTPLPGSPALGTAFPASALMSDALLSTASSYLPAHHNIGAR